MSIAINQLPTLLTSTIIFMFIILLVLMSVKLMQTYRNKFLHLLFIGGLFCAGVQQTVLLFNFQNQMSLPISIISTSTGMLSFIIINYVLLRLSIANGKVKPLPYILFSIFILLASVLSYWFEPIQTSHLFNSFGLPILELSFVIIVCILLTQVKAASPYSYHFIAMTMMLVHMLANLFHYYLIGKFAMWLHLTEKLSYILYFIFIFLLLFTLITEKMIHIYLTSLHDHMTGLYLRKVFIKKMENLLKQKPIAIIFCDIDNFKYINDTLGHLEADRILIKVAQIVKQETLSYGFAGRYGGEEIVAGIDISAVKPMAIAEQLRIRISEEAGVTVSIGVSTTNDSTDLQTLLKYADEAMYSSKTTGKNKVTLYKGMSAKKSKS